MQTEIIRMIDDFEHGRLSRRQLIAHVTGGIAASLSATVPFADQQAQPAAPPERPPRRVLHERDSADANAAGGPGLDFDHDFAAEFPGRGYGFIGEKAARPRGILNPLAAPTVIQAPQPISRTLWSFPLSKRHTVTVAPS